MKSIKHLAESGLGKDMSAMPITDLLERNSKLYGEEIALVEINPEIQGPSG